MAKLSTLLERLRIDDDARLVDPEKAGTDCVISDNPSTGEPLMAVRLDRAEDLEKTVQRCTAVQKEWRVLPAPVRGEIVRRIGVLRPLWGLRPRPRTPPRPRSPPRQSRSARSSPPTA